jgi:predicted phosphodiesterase
MKIFIIGDTHFSSTFEEERYEYLRKQIEEADQVIINGDFWDRFLVTFDQFVDSKWSKLFPLLRRKNTIYIYGNHDAKVYCDERVSLFSIKQVSRWEIILRNKQKLIITHGDEIAPEFDAKFPRLTKYFSKLYPYEKKIETMVLIKNIYLPIKRYFQIKLLRQVLRHVSKVRKDHDMVFVVGHSHQHTDLRDRGVVSIGQFNHGFARCMIVEDTHYTLNEEPYTVRPQIEAKYSHPDL